jgi:NitT/TauT family transport system substrate-binding protein
MKKRKIKLGPVPFLIVVLAIAFGLYKYVIQPNIDKIAPEIKKPGSILTESARSDGLTIDIGVVTWGGYAGGEYFNNGFEASQNSRFYKQYGFMVKFHVMDLFEPSRNAWKSSDVDLLWVTADAYPTETAGLKALEPLFLFQVDWSRKGDAIVVASGINSVRDFYGKKIAVALGTPSHTFLLKTLQADDIEYSDVEIVGVSDAIAAAELFKTKAVDIAVVWSPDDDLCIQARTGSKVIRSTGDAPYIIADGFFAKKSFVDKYPLQCQQLYEGWMTGNAEINGNQTVKEKAAQILAVGLKVDYQFALNAINKVRLVTHGDNMNFFGLNPSYNGVTGDQLYSSMKRLYGVINLAPTGTPDWQEVSTTRIVQAANARLANTPGQEAEGKMTFGKATTNDYEKTAVSSKTIRVNFAFGSAALDENAQMVIEYKFGELAQLFAGNRIRIIGHTDNVGTREANIALSKRRAESGREYLIRKYGFDQNRIITVGMGPDSPVASNDTEEGRAKNRRIEFQFIE